MAVEDCTHAPDALAAEIQREGRPARRCRSALWLHRHEIAQWVSEGYSYAQIARVLSRVGHTVTAAWLERWCRRNLGRVYEPESPGSDPPVSVRPSPPTGDARPAPAGPSAPVAPPASADNSGPPPIATDSDVTDGVKSMKEMLRATQEAETARRLNAQQADSRAALPATGGIAAEIENFLKSTK